MKTESDIYNEVQNYIEGSKHNRPCTLASIKKVFRTPKVIDLIFSRPDIFNLNSEIKHVPSEYLTEKVLVKYVLSNPRAFYLLAEDQQTLPVMIAFEISKRRSEDISHRMWGSSGVRFHYQGKIIEYLDCISNIANFMNNTLDYNKHLSDYISYIEQTSTEILKYVKNNDVKLIKEKPYVPKYSNIDFNLNERLFILISGRPDSGKTTFSYLLAGRINDSISLDSDNLLNSGYLDKPLSEIVSNDRKVIILSDLYADRFFRKEEIGNARTVNLLMQPSSIEKMYRHTKYMYNIPFEDYKKHEIESIHYNIADPIIVNNDYTYKIQMEADRVLEEIFKKLDLSLPTDTDNLYNSINSFLNHGSLKKHK